MRLTKLFLLLAVLLCALLLSSCARMEFSAENLMDAPMLTPEQTQIREALYDGLRTRDVKFKYPKAGQYRSAFVMYDLDSDGKDEALVFYDPQIGESNTWVGILTQANDGWVLSGGRSGKGVSVDSVAFQKLSPDDDVNIVVGWSQSGGGGKTVEVYSYRPKGNETLVQLIYADYNEMLLYDLNDDGLTELLLLRCNTLQGEAMAQLVAMTSRNELKITSSVPLRGGVTAFERVQVGMLDSVTKAIFIDAALETGGTLTSILRYDAAASRKLVDVMKQLPDNAQLVFTRPQKIFCEDFNSDGIVEIPYQPEASFLPGYDENTEDPLRTVQYVRLESESFVPVWEGVVNVEDGWRFELPEEWLGMVTVKIQPGTGEWRFFAYDGSLDNSYQQLLRIGTTNKSQPPDKNADEEYRLLSTRGMYEYRAYIPKESGQSPLGTTYQDLEKLFSILS